MTIKLLTSIVKGEAQEPRVGGAMSQVVQGIVEANKLHCDAKRNKKSLKDMEMTDGQRWLLFDLEELSSKVSWANKLQGLAGFVEGLGVVGEWVVKSILKKVIEGNLKSNESLSTAQKNAIIENVDKLVPILIPMLTNLLKKHDLAYYAKFFEELNNMVHKDKPVDAQEVAEKLQEFVSHFLDNEFDQYKEPLFEVLASLPNLIEK